MNVRELGEADLPLFKDIRLEALRSDPDAFGQTLEAARATPEAEWRESFGSALEAGAILVAESDSGVVGMCATGPDANDPSSAFLWGMFVRRDARGSGAGALLMRHAEQWARGRGLKEVHARVAAPNGDAIAFYDALGYEIGPIVGMLRPGSAIPVHSIMKRLA
jgi:GNAT superfamily N-acetyltransferase